MLEMTAEAISTKLLRQGDEISLKLSVADITTEQLGFTSANNRRMTAPYYIGSQFVNQPSKDDINVMKFLRTTPTTTSMREQARDRTTT